MLISFYFPCDYIGAHAELQSANRPVVLGKTTSLRQKRRQTHYYYRIVTKRAKAHQHLLL